MYFKILPMAAIQPHSDTKLSKKSSIIESGKTMFYFNQCANDPKVCISKKMFYIVCPTYLLSLGNLREGGDTERILSGRRIFSVRKRLEPASSSQITLVPSQETGERQSFMQEVNPPERSTFLQFTYSHLCQNFSRDRRETKFYARGQISREINFCTIHLFTFVSKLLQCGHSIIHSLIDSLFFIFVALK